MYPGTYSHSDPNRPAVILARTGEVVTYRELDQRSNAFAHHLRDAGLRQGDVVAVLMDRNTRFHEVAWAARRSGLIATTVNRYLEFDDIVHVINDSGARVLVIDAGQAHVARRLTPDLVPGLTRRLVVGGEVPGFTSYEQAVAGMPTEPVPDEVEGDLLTYSSGTTGRPKGVRERVGGGPISAETDPYLPRGPLGGLGDGSVLLAPGLHHGAPMYLSMAAHRLGGTVVVVEEFDAAETLEVIERYGVTHAMMAPYMFVRLLKLPEAKRARHSVDSLRLVLVSFAPGAVDVEREMIDWWGPVFVRMYGSSEKAGGAFITTPEWLAHPGSVGRPVGCTVHILDDDGNELPAGRIGRICFADSAVRPEFHNLPKDLGRRDDRGFVDVGDVGYVDEDGYLYHVDRKASEIRVGGVAVYPQQVEDVLVAHPSVLDAAVLGVPEPSGRVRVHAVVQLVEGVAPVPERELVAFCQERLTAEQCPAAVSFGRVPRSDHGKVYRRHLRSRLAHRGAA
ncbi:AMP-binding protein [Actinophytocola sp.]|uniref:AMP-binding protein n=1 Tax=Actinophytocola sp. TaxID=1872138 RepID=UPI00389AC160